MGMYLKIPLSQHLILNSRKSPHFNSTCDRIFKFETPEMCDYKKLYSQLGNLFWTELVNKKFRQFAQTLVISKLHFMYNRTTPVIIIITICIGTNIMISYNFVFTKVVIFEICLLSRCDLMFVIIMN